MSYPPPYDPTNSFSDDESNQAAGRSTVRTVALDTEFANVAATLAAVLVNQQALQRADTKLRDFIVEPYALSEGTRAMLVAAGKSIRGEWQPFTEYRQGDLVGRSGVALVCQTAHNSGPTFNLGFWIAISGDGSAQAWAEQAGLSQTAAAAASLAAGAAAEQAGYSQDAARASEMAAGMSAQAAQNSANSIAGLAPVNLNAYMLTFLAAASAAAARANLGVVSAADFLSTDADKGASLVMDKKFFTGAIDRRQSSINDDFATIYDILPSGFNTATGNATPYVQQLLNCGLKTIEFLGVSLKCDDVTAPERVELRGVNWTRLSANAGSGLRLNSGCKVTGRLMGTGSTGIAQYLLSPAGAGVADVTLDVDLSNSTFGALINASATRWKGRIHVHDLVRSPTAPVSFEGSALNLQALTFSELAVTCAGQIPGAGLFVQGGVRDNKISIQGDRFGFYGLYATSTGSDAAIARNKFEVNVQAILNLNGVAAERSGVKLVGKCYNNQVQPFIVGTTDTTYGVFVTASGTDYPINNRITDGSFEGFFAGENMLRMFNSSGTFVARNALKGRAGAAAVGMYGSGTNPSPHGGFVVDNDIDMQGNNTRGVYVDITTVPSYIGPNNIRSTGNALRVDDQSGGKRQGYSRRVRFSGSTPVHAANGVANYDVALPDQIQVAGRLEVLNVTGSAGLAHTDNHRTPPDQSVISFQIGNGIGGAQSFTYDGVVEGD